MEVVLYIIASILCLLGMVTVIRAIVYALFTTDCEKSLCHIVCLKNDSAEMVLRDAVEQINWNRIGKNNEIIAVDMGLSSMGKDICKVICRDYDVDFCSVDELNQKLKDKFL